MLWSQVMIHCLLSLEPEEQLTDIQILQARISILKKYSSALRIHTIGEFVI